jgi:hypothetical protein
VTDAAKIMFDGLERGLRQMPTAGFYVHSILQLVIAVSHVGLHVF